jgi:hypothetical protein
MSLWISLNFPGLWNIDTLKHGQRRLQGTGKDFTERGVVWAASFSFFTGKCFSAERWDKQFSVCPAAPRFRKMPEEKRGIKRDADAPVAENGMNCYNVPIAKGRT